MKVGIFYHCDPAGFVPSGIDTFIRGILQWAPADLEYTLYGATSDPRARPVGREVAFELGGKQVRYLPLISVDAGAGRSRIPLTVQYTYALRKLIQSRKLEHLDVLDFHRIEPIFAFRNDPRPKNVIQHQDMSVLRDKNSDIKWRHAPWLYEWIERRMFGTVDRVFSVRESAVERYAGLYPEMRDKFSFIPTWVDTAVFNLSMSQDELVRLRADWRRERSIPAESELMVFVGRLDRQKDPLLLLDAFARVSTERPGLHLAIIGDGALRATVEAAIKSDGLRGRVSMLGAIDRFEIVRALRSADLFVMSSAYEGMPIAVLEALATGVPVVSTNVGEMRRVVSDGVNGYLSISRDPAAMAAAMVSALRKLPEIRGTPCGDSVSPYQPEKVLARIFENHRRQAKQPAVGL